MKKKWVRIEDLRVASIIAREEIDNNITTDHYSNFSPEWEQYEYRKLRKEHDKLIS